MLSAVSCQIRNNTYTFVHQAPVIKDEELIQLIAVVVGRSPRGRSVWMMVGHVSVSLYGPTRPPGACSRISHQLVALLTEACVWRALRAY